MQGRARRDARVVCPRLLAAFAFCFGAGLPACAPPPAPPPNVLLILADDLGFGELGANGRPEMGTIHMDQLAAEGARFTRHYADSSCAPARAALLTGRHPARSGFRPHGRGLPAETTTLPELLRAHGYTTRHLGKWHLGGSGIFGLDSSPAASLPSNHGFDHWFGFLDSLLVQRPTAAAPGGPALPRYTGASYFNPWLLGSHDAARHHQGHLTDLLTERAIDFLRSPGQEPWFLNLWYLAPHFPDQPHPRFWKDPQKGPADPHRALVHQLDESVGRVLAALAESGQAEHTLVVLLSDNGSPARTDPQSNAPFVGKKLGFDEGGLRTPLLLRWPGHVPAGLVLDEVVSIQDLYPTIARTAGVSLEELESLDGRPLQPLLAGGSREHRPLFWEQAQPDGSLYYSVLSSDGRFRLSRGRGATSLLDLRADPNGGRDVAAAKPDVIHELDRLFRAWRRDALHTEVRLRSTGPDGRSVATGDDLRRSPGWGGFTFGVGVTPAERPRPDAEEVIARQPGLWELTRTPRDALRLRLGDLRLKGRKLRSGECHAVVVTGHFVASSGPLDLDQSMLALYLDGVLQQSVNLPGLPNPSDLAAPTWIGVGADGLDDFRGTLGAPVFLNTRVVEHEEGPETSVRDLDRSLCPTGPAA